MNRTNWGAGDGTTKWSKRLEAIPGAIKGEVSRYWKALGVSSRFIAVPVVRILGPNALSVETSKVEIMEALSPVETSDGIFAAVY